MELGITRSKAALVVVALVGAGWWWVSRGGDVPKLPPEVREVMPKLPGSAPEAPAAAPAPAAGKKRAATPAPVAEEPATGEGASAAPRKPERTPDEKARSKVALAVGYAENGIFDKAYAALEEAEAFGPSPAVKAEIEAAEEQVTALMRARRR